MSLGPINYKGGECPLGECPLIVEKVGHTEIVGKCGIRDGRVFAVCGAHVAIYQQYPETYTVELYPVPPEKREVNMSDSHFHPCPACKIEAVECCLALGADECGKAKCEGCSLSVSVMGAPPWCSAVQPEKGFVCTLSHGHGGDVHVAHSSGKNEVSRWPITPASRPKPGEEPKTDEKCSGCGHEYGIHSRMTKGPCVAEGGACKCPHWNAPKQEEGVSPNEAEKEEEEEEVEAKWECPNCGDEFDADDEEDVKLECSSCEKIICDACGTGCNDCSKIICDDHYHRCQCCDVKVCEGCKGEHGT